MLGGEVDVPTLSGEVAMTIPAGHAEQPPAAPFGPRHAEVKGGGAGDQYVRLIGQLPQDLTDQEKKLFKELAALRNGNRSWNRYPVEVYRRTQTLS